MTCIAAFISKGVVIMGGDSAGVNPAQDLQLRADSKVFIKGLFLLGVSGSWRTCHELRYKPNPSPRIGEDLHQWLTLTFLPWLRENVLDVDKAEILLGFQGKLYHIYGAQQVSQEVAAYEACGCAAQIARGAFYVLNCNPNISGREKVTFALEAAERFCSGVRGPFNILEID